MKEMIILIPIFLPIIAGLVLRNIPSMKENRKIRDWYLMFFLTAELILVWAMMLKNGLAIDLFTIVDDVNIRFCIDPLAMWFTGMVSVIWWVVGIYSLEYMKHAKKEQSYYTFYLISEGVLCGLIYAGNLVTLYMFYECMTLLTMPMVLHDRTRRSVAAARKYMFYSIFGASCALGGIILLYVNAPSITFTPGGVFDEAAFALHPTMYLIIVAVMIVGFCGKSGMFPLHSWLPTAHPLAPAPASAVLSGIITKMGVVAVIRTVFYIFGADFLRGTWVQIMWMILATITIFMGSMMAFLEPSMKRRFAYSTVSQVSYILLGLSTMSLEGLTGSFLHVIFHSMAKIVLFLTAGVIIYYTGEKKVPNLSGIGKQMPIVMVPFTVAAASLVGVPFFSGFISKEFLAHGTLEAGVPYLQYITPIVLLISATLTAGYLFPIVIDGFYPKNEKKVYTKINVDPKMWGSLIILAVLTIAIGVFPNPLSHFVEAFVELLL